MPARETPSYTALAPGDPLTRALAKLFDWTARRPFQSQLGWFMLGVSSCGIGRYPHDNYFQIAQNPFVRDPQASFYQDSLLLPLVAHLFGLHNSLFLFHGLLLLCLLGAFVVAGSLTTQLHGRFVGALIAPAIAIHPVLLSTLNWLGSPDPITLLCTLVLALANGPWLLGIVAGIGVINHPQGLVAGGLLVLLRLSAAERAFSRWQALAILVGLSSGYLLVRAFLSYFDITITPSRLDFMFAGIWLDLRIKELPLSIFTLYGGLWFVVISCLGYGFRYAPRYYGCFLLVQVLAATLTFFTYDTTRVFGLLTLATVIHCMVQTLALARTRGDEAGLGWTFMLILSGGLLLPRYSSWNGTIRFPETLTSWQWLIDQLR